MRWNKNSPQEFCIHLFHFLWKKTFTSFCLIYQGFWETLATQLAFNLSPATFWFVLRRLGCYFLSNGNLADIHVWKAASHGDIFNQGIKGNIASLNLWEWSPWRTRWQYLGSPLWSFVLSRLHCAHLWSCEQTSRWMSQSICLNCKHLTALINLRVTFLKLRKFKGMCLNSPTVTMFERSQIVEN